MANGQRQGPVPESILLDLLRSGALSMTTPVWRPGLPVWTSADRAPGIMAMLPPSLPADASARASDAHGAPAVEPAMERRIATAPASAAGGADMPRSPDSRPPEWVEAADVKRFFVPSAFLISFRVLVHNAVRFLVVTITCFLPLVLYWLEFFKVAFRTADRRFPSANTEALSSASRDRFVITTLVLGVFLDLLASGALTHGTAQYLRQGRTTVAECLLAALTNVWRLFVVTVLSLVCFVGGAAIVLPVGVFAGLVLGPSYYEYVGGVLAVVVSVVLLCQFWVAVPMAVIEQ